MSDEVTYWVAGIEVAAAYVILGMVIYRMIR